MFLFVSEHVPFKPIHLMIPEEKSYACSCTMYYFIECLVFSRLTDRLAKYLKCYMYMYYNVHTIYLPIFDTMKLYVDIDLHILLLKIKLHLPNVSILMKEIKISKQSLKIYFISL